MSATSARRIGAVLPLGGALLAAVFIYFPALNSPFHSDDYLLLLASRDMPWSDFLRSSFDPGADPGALRLSANYWRPLSFVTFGGDNECTCIAGLAGNIEHELGACRIGQHSKLGFEPE